MNMVRLHYADGSVETFDVSYAANLHTSGARKRLGVVWAGRYSGTPIATTNAQGRPGGGAEPPYDALPRWNPDRLAELRFVSNMATAKAAEREALVSHRPSHFIVDEADLDPPSLEAKHPLAWWFLGAALVLAIAAAMIGQSVGSAGA